MKLNRLRVKSEAVRKRCITHYALRITPLSSSGFTLVELMAVIVIIGIVSGIVIAGAAYANRSAMKARTQATIQQVCTAVEMFSADGRGYPADMWCTVDNDVLREEQCVWPCETLWFWLEYQYPHKQKGYTAQPYIIFKREQLATGDTRVSAKWDDAPGNFMRVVDAWGNPLNYKSNNGRSYRLPTQFSPSDQNENRTLPRHNRTSYDICSYGANGTTWQDRDKPFDRQQDLKLDQPRSVSDNSNPSRNGQIPDYFFKPFDALASIGSGVKHCYGGEDDDDLNNWQHR